MVATPVLPATTFTLGVEETSLKPGPAATVKAMVADAVMLPDTAVRVTVAVPTGADAAAVSVSLLVEPVLAGLNAAVTPLGRPPIVRLAALVKPFSGVMVMVLVPAAPWGTVKAAGAAASVKVGPAFTVKLNVTEVDHVPEVPVTVTVVVPVAAADVALNVAMLLVAVVAGLNETVTPLGRPAAASVALPLKPFLGVTVMVLVAVAPCTTFSVEAEVVTEKLAAGARVNVTATVVFRLPDVPVMVTVLVPTAALALATTLNVLAVAVAAGLNDAVTPLGRPETARFTVPLNPPTGATLMETVPVPPCATFRVVDDGVRP